VDLEINGTGNHELTFTATGLASVASSTFEVAAGGGDPDYTPAFFSDWASVSPGTSSGITGDAGKWTLGGVGHEVVATTGLGFPATMTNCIKVNAKFERSGWCAWLKQGLSAPAAGTTRYYRVYARMDFDDRCTGNGDHPWQDGNAVGDSNYIISVHYGTGQNGDEIPPRTGQWQVGPVILESGSTIYFDNGPWLDHTTVYRLEWAVERIDATTYDFAMRVFDDATSTSVPIYDDADFPADTGGGTLATRGPWTFKNAAYQEGITGGINDFEMGAGPTGNGDWWTSSAQDFTYGYQGGYALVDRVESIAAGEWIGPYGNVA
jgi:hypothetical protein